jgi:hypothetical protein
MRCTGNVARMLEINTCKIIVGKPEGKRVTLKWILKKRDLRMWIGFKWLKIGSSGGLF